MTMPSRRKRKISNSSVEWQLDPVLRQTVHNLFEKKFEYSNPKENSWKLPENFEKSQDWWEIEELMTLKSSLNNLKDKLSDKDIREWHQHTNFMNLAGNIISELRQTIRPELCTQAWCKFYEILSSYNILDDNNDFLNSVHLCEAPGAFITSLNHFLYTGYLGTWNWFGSTLNPYYEGNNPSEMIDDDRFVRDTYGSWDFGLDNTGDLMVRKNLQQLRDRAVAMGPVQLVTADGSIDCQGNPAEQEKVVSKLQYCEALAAILILSPGGSLVLKKFTMFECDTICLLYLLNCLFTEVSVFKPATSKSGNSEVYVVCLKFKGLEKRQDQIEKLCQRYFDNSNTQLDTCIFSKENIPMDFLNQHMECCRFFTSLQQETIETNLIYYNSMSEEFTSQISSMKDYCTEIYFNKYSVQSIPSHVKITLPQKQHRLLNNFRNREVKRNEGTFHDRVKLEALPWEQKVLQYETYDIDHNHIEWFENNYQLKEDEVTHWSCATGNPVSSVKSSRFCDGKLIEQIQEIKRNLKLDVLTNDTIKTTNTTAIAASLDVLYHQSPSDFPCHVTLVSSAKFDDVEIQQKDYVDKLTCEKELADVHCKEKEVVILASDRPENELEFQRILLTHLVDITKVITDGCTVLLQISTCLTRFTAGIIYILSSCFKKIGILVQHRNDSLQQTLICYKYSGLPHFLLEHCCQLVDKYFAKDNKLDCILLETVPILTLLADADFVNFLTSRNERLLKSYINQSVLTIKKTLPDQT